MALAVAHGDGTELTVRLQQNRAEIEQLLAARLAENGPSAQVVPSRLLAAMRHAVLAGGKRIRPFLLCETVRMLGGDMSAARCVGAALELVHCYSLVHDDLPAMDDDDLRRGSPTVHVAFDEATAILAGDALLTLAFDWLSAPDLQLAPSVKLSLIHALAAAAGPAAMVGGQMMDLQAEQVTPGAQDVARLQSMKTGALIRFSCRAGAIMSGAGDREIAALSSYGEAVGVAFQIADDLLDVEANMADVGKRVAKDAQLGKANFVSCFGVQAARERLATLTEEACRALEIFGDRARLMMLLAKNLAHRRY